MKEKKEKLSDSVTPSQNQLDKEEITTTVVDQSVPTTTKISSDKELGKVVGPLQFLIIHCSATKPFSKRIDAEAIKNFHLNDRKWTRVGYADIIEESGAIKQMVDYNSDNWVQDGEMTWGAIGMNHKSRHVCYIGGVDADNNPVDTRTAAQKHSLGLLVKAFLFEHPDAKIAGHYEFANKACPSFNVPEWLSQIEIPEKNIYRK